MKNPIDKVFDTRDLIEYIEYLRDELVEMYNESTESEIESIDEVEEWPDDLYKDYEDYQNIVEFAAELKNNATDYAYGEGVIRWDYWEDYVKQLIEDCGYISKDFPSFIEVDWNATAENVSDDYAIITYDGDDYYVRKT